MQQIKETGGLIKLLAYIVDTAPPEDDEAAKPKGGGKGGKGEKSGGPGGKGGKKGKEEGKPMNAKRCMHLLSSNIISFQYITVGTIEIRKSYKFFERVREFILCFQYCLMHRQNIKPCLLTYWLISMENYMYMMTGLRFTL